MSIIDSEKQVCTQFQSFEQTATKTYCTVGFVQLAIGVVQCVSRCTRDGYMCYLLTIV